MARTNSDGTWKSFGGPIRTKLRSKMQQEVYKFCPFKISKLKPTGNSRLQLKCPKPRSGHRIVADNANIYSFGGYNPHVDIQSEIATDFVLTHACFLFKELWKFNMASRTWKKLKTKGPMPEELASHSAVLLGNHMLVFGGTGVPFGMSSSNSVHICNLKTLAWKKFNTTGEYPIKQYGQAVAMGENKLYVVGGTTGFEYSMSVHCLNLQTKEWTELDARLQPEPRYRHEIAFEDNKLFVFGGGTAVESFGLKEIPVFSIETDEWKTSITSADHPMSRRCHGCVQMGSDVYICGGHDRGTVFSDLWKMNLKTMQWQKLPCSLPQPVYFHSAALSPEGQMFIFGGVTKVQENTRTNATYSVWLKVPSLREMSWQALLHYVPRISAMSRAQLRAEGIPPAFLERVDYENEQQRASDEAADEAEEEEEEAAAAAEEEEADGNVV